MSWESPSQERDLQPPPARPLLDARQHRLAAALTRWGQDEDKRRATEAGFDHHLTKPVDPAALEKLLAELRATTG